MHIYAIEVVDHKALCHVDQYWSVIWCGIPVPVWDGHPKFVALFRFCSSLSLVDTMTTASFKLVLQGSREPPYEISQNLCRHGKTTHKEH